MTLQRTAPWLMVALAAALALSYGVCPQDDAFITFRYASNWVEGHGLVYNPGEWVEGYTNLSWTLLMGGAIAAGLEPLSFATAAGIAGLGAAVWATAKLAQGDADTPWWLTLIAPALVATDPQIALESAEGLETTTYVALITLGVLLALRESTRPGAWRHVGSSAVFALAALTRPEAPYLAALTHVGLLLAHRHRWRDQLVASLAAAVPVAVTLAAVTGWRLATYGDPLPNTFYAKTGGLRLDRGALYLWDHVVAHPALYGLVALRVVGGKMQPRTWVAGTLCVGVGVYVMAVGGDFKPTARFLLPALPLLALLAQETVQGVWSKPKWVLGAVAVLALPYGVWTGVQLDGYCRGWGEIRRGNYHARREAAELLAATLHPDHVLAIHSAGVIPYYAGHHTIDMWGLTDRHIARNGSAEFGQDLPGHDIGDPAYVFAQDPALYIPEDHVVARERKVLHPEPGFPDDFTDRYTAISVTLESGAVFNLWVRNDVLQTWVVTAG